MKITIETATVYRGGGRRWLTKRSAIKAEARAKIKSRCDCDTSDDGTYGTIHLTCSLHQPGRYEKILRRLTRVYAAAMSTPNKGESK